jgi:hypothetical protein
MLSRAFDEDMLHSYTGCSQVGLSELRSLHAVGKGARGQTRRFSLEPFCLIYAAKEELRQVRLPILFTA